MKSFFGTIPVYESMDLVQNLLIKKKNCPWTWSMTGGPWTRSMKVVHGPGPKRGSMDPWSMFCPHPGSLESVIAITRRLSSLNLGPKRSKEQAKMKRNSS